MNIPLNERYLLLFESWRKYQKEMFDKSVQPDTDWGEDCFGIDARIRYGLHCCINNNPIPPNCEISELENFVRDQISYREEI